MGKKNVFPPLWVGEGGGETFRQAAERNFRVLVLFARGVSIILCILYSQEGAFDNVLQYSTGDPPLIALMLDESARLPEVLLRSIPLQPVLPVDGIRIPVVHPIDVYIVHRSL